MKALLYAGGVFHLAFAAFHLGFWRLFRWNDELRRLGFINRNVMQILNLCLTFVFLAWAWLSFAHVDALLEPGLGHALLGVIALFWLLRAIEQAVFFRLGNAASLAFFLAFVGGAALYAVPLLA